MKSTVSWLSYSVLMAGFSTLALDIISGPQCGQVTCSPGLTCEIEDVLPFPTDKSGFEVSDLEVVAKLCCPTKPPNRNRPTCLPCILINIQFNSSDEEQSGYDDNFGVRDDNEDDDANVVVCFGSPEAVIQCKKIYFKVTPRTAPEQAHLSLVLCEPKIVQFGSEVSVTAGSKLRTVKVPSVDKVCSTELQKSVQACNAPNFSTKTDQVRDVVNLRVEGKNTSAFPLKMCLQHELSGICKEWKEKTIPLHSVTLCMCIQMWWDKGDERSHRHRRCPFRNDTERFRRNVWENVTVSVARGVMNSGASMLSWNVSAPCRLQAQVWTCQRGGCGEQSNFTRNLLEGPWRGNRKGFWQVQGAFEHVEPCADLCVMVKIQGMDQKNKIIGPFCPNADSSRWRMSLLVLLVVLLIGVAVLGVCFLHSTVKRWTWKGLHKEWRAGRKGHMVLLSPPDAEGPVSEQLCELGSLLVAQGFRVSVDLWSRAQQGSLGPLPWLHSQLHLLDTQGGRVLVVLTRSAWEKAQQWGLDPLRQGLLAQGEDPQAGGRGEMDQGSSPYKDVFSACLSCIQADYQRGVAGERFTLVTFESHPARPSTGSQRGLPELLQGLPWFHLPSQRRGLLSALSGGRRGVSWRWTEGLKGGLSSVWPTGL